MTAKDLNLLTDPAELANWARDNMGSQPAEVEEPPRRARPRADLSAVNAGVSGTAATLAYEQAATEQPKPSAAPATARAATRRTAWPAQPSRAPWILAAAIAVMNMLFLVLAGLWLTGTGLQGTLAPPGVVAQDAPADNPRLNALGDQLSALNLQMSELRADIEVLQVPAPSIVSPAVPETIDHSAQTDGIASAAAADPAPDGANTAPAPVTETAAPPQTWQVNLGDFLTRKAAQATLAQLADIGLQGQVRSVDAAGNTTYLVTLDNFLQRTDAEEVANDIMRRTELNGLWVARTSP